MNSLIIGTAGHIDHGKSTLIKAMNGFDGDEMALEKAKGITIDLSFSNLSSADTNIAFIDVPGHEKLVKTMISGAFAFSACLFVVDINEGLKAQSVEHLQILRLLDVENIILVLSKCDLCEDINSRQSVILADIERLGVKVSQIFHTSIKNQKSIDALKAYLFTLPAKQSAPNALFRYYIDRVFTLKGVGAVVTGSLNEGAVSVGEKIFCLDLGRDLQVKNIQIHDRDTPSAAAFNRVALNLNCDYKELKKGFLLSKKGFFKPFKDADAVFLGEIKGKKSVLFCVGSKAVSAKISLLESCGEGRNFVHFEFEKPMFLCFNERFIILENSRFAGGGRILNPINEPLKKPQKIKLLQMLEKMDFAAAFEFLKSTHKFGFGLLSSYQRFKLPHDEALRVAKGLKNAFVDEKAFNVYDIAVCGEIEEFVHFVLQKNEYAMLSPHFLAARLGWASENLCEFVLKKMSAKLDFEGGIYFKKGINFEKLEMKNHDALFERLKFEGATPAAPYNIYEFLEIDRAKGDGMMKKLTKNGLVVRLAHNLFVEKSALDAMERDCLALLKTHPLDVSAMKTHFKFSRKYAIAYLEWLDKHPQVVKMGEKRLLKVSVNEN